LANKRLTLTSWLLLVLAAAFFGLIGVLVYWGGRIESTLLVFGEPVFVTLDASRSRIWLFFSLPLALVAAALAARKVRDPR
jgi:hypothetical protein